MQITFKEDIYTRFCGIFNESHKLSTTKKKKKKWVIAIVSYVYCFSFNKSYC
jgi:hypothetical protein